MHLFVDHRGRRALELTADEVLKLLRHGSASVLGGTPLVDRAMDEVVRALKRGRDA
jgi:hypothetical protein